MGGNITGQYETTVQYIAEMNDAVHKHRPKQVNALLEWGAGASTTLFYYLAKANGARLFVTIDHVGGYLDSIVSGLDKAAFFKPLHVPLFESPSLPANKEDCYYSSCPMKFGVTFDILFIDGRIRNECLLLAALMASPEALIILHDFRRIRMEPAKFLFDQVDANYRGALVLKRKKVLDSLAARFMESLSGSETRPNIAADSGELSRGNAGFREEDKAFFQQALRKYLGPERRRVLEWGTKDSTQLLLDHLRAMAPAFFLSVKASNKESKEFQDAVKQHDFFEAPAVSLEGTRMSGARDPDFHFSSSPIHYKKKFDFVYVGSERRNECLLTAALLLDKDGLVLLAGGNRRHYAPGRALFDTVDRIGGFHVLKLVPTLERAFQGFLDSLSEGAKVGGLDPADRKSPAGDLYGPLHESNDCIQELKTEIIVDNNSVDSVRIHNGITVAYEFTLAKKVNGLNVSLCFYSKAGVKLTVLSTLNGDLLKDIHLGKVRCRVNIADFNLNPGQYVLVICIHEGKDYLSRTIVKEFSVVASDRSTWELVDFNYDYCVDAPEEHRVQKSFT